MVAPIQAAIGANYIMLVYETRHLGRVKILGILLQICGKPSVEKVRLAYRPLLRQVSGIYPTIS
jgi:hypothetical protein